MTDLTNFSPTAASYAYQEHYIKIEDTQGKTLYTQTFESRKAMADEFDGMIDSKKPYSFVARAFLPVRCDNIGNFFKSLFVPHTVSFKISLIVFTILFDLMTFPVRALTSIPYVIYSKCSKKNKIDHKIIALIKPNKEAAKAISEGKVVVRAISEDFGSIEPGLLDGKPSYRVKGKITAEYSDVYIKRPWARKKITSSKGSTTYDNISDSSIKSLYHAFRSA